MANLSSLLNPAPSAQEAPGPRAQQPAPLKIDGQDHRDHGYQPGYSNAQSPTRQSVTSPGLDALAAAASSTAPLASPTQHSSSMAQAMYQGQGRSQLSSRPESSDGLSSGPQQVAYPSQHQHTSSLGQYHHGPNGSDHSTSNFQEGPSRTLAPMRQSPPPRHGDSTAMGNALSSQSKPNPDTIGAESSSTNTILNSQAQPATTQIRQPSSTDPLSVPAEFVPPQAEQVDVKAELTEVPSEMRIKNATLGSIDTSTPHLSKHEPSPGTPLRTVTSNTSPNPTPAQDSSTMTSKPKPAPSKKRAPPKKGTATKPPAKKRKVETDSGKASPSGARTGTPATSRASATPVPKNRKPNSVTPDRSSSVTGPMEDDEDDGELELFCICRQPDDHTVMIGCDGPCEDWFHTRCVDMNDEKVALIFKWYCPNCAAQGHDTLWKRMCRLGGCQKPARVEAPHRSKYCSDEHGREFFRRLIPTDSPRKAGASGTTKKSRRKANYTDHDGNDADLSGQEVNGEEDQEDNHGGVLSAGELKALLDASDDVAAFKKLGDGVLSPPETDGEAEKKVSYSPEETVQLDSIAKKRADIEARRVMLSDRDKFVLMVANRGKAVLADLKEKDKSFKDICGYDARLAWADDEFNQWRASAEGQEQLKNSVLLPQPTPLGLEPFNREGDKEETEVGPGVCKRKRCERHRAWFKQQQQDNALEKDLVRQDLKKLDEEEKGVKDRAMIRNLEEGPEMGDPMEA